MIAKTRTLKKRIPELLPKKRWLSLDEACAWMDMSKNIFLAWSKANDLDMRQIGAKRYYRVSQLDLLIEKSIA